MFKSFLVVVVCSMLIAVGAATPRPAGSSQPVKALFIYWRGQTDCARGLQAGLKKRGFKLRVTEFDARRDKQRLDAFLGRLRPGKYKFIYTFGTTVSLALQQKVRKTPIVFGIVSAPVRAGLIKAWGPSGTNVVGLSATMTMADHLGLILKLGRYKKIGFLHNPQEKNSVIELNEIRRLLEAKGVTLIAARARSDREVPAAVKRLIEAKVDLVFLPSVSLVIANARPIAAALTRRKIPTYGSTVGLVKAGAMIGLGVTYAQVGRILAAKAALILAGKDPGQIPSERVSPEQATIWINPATIKKLGRALPASVMKKSVPVR
jgi:putative ABC transport system substrate-binding protein